MMKQITISSLARRFATLAAVAALGLAVAMAWPRPTPIFGGDIRELPPRETFLSGGERSEAVLKEMSETLRRIDTRLEHFERALRDATGRPGEPEPAPQPAAVSE